MPAVRWLDATIHDLHRLMAFLDEKSPQVAMRAARRIREAADQLRHHPHMGRRMRDDTGRRELIVPFGNAAYVLRYRLEEKGDAVIVIRVWHSRERRR